MQVSLKSHNDIPKRYNSCYKTRIDVDVYIKNVMSFFSFRNKRKQQNFNEKESELDSDDEDEDLVDSSDEEDVV
ncbi:hypothetical protein BpHYR1_017111 [Brachionus plicatilis]|uniref:Uncharacterized protein n=1 Tax=Brachionus plicatilis TaxID=10195 RepID=A0A3M7PDE0_BRAPC|nr:hypothetical protein BpHYR1_017111 [Brachionus plicatilis]